MALSDKAIICLHECDLVGVEKELVVFLGHELFIFAHEDERHDAHYLKVLICRERVLVIQLLQVNFNNLEIPVLHRELYH